MTWIYNESGALKLKLQGLSVIDGNDTSGRPVLVRFRLPEDEPATAVYPMIVINNPQVSVAHDREHRGYIALSYAPEGYNYWGEDQAPTLTPADSPYTTENPIPMNLDFQVTLYTRKVLHGYQLLPTLSTVPYMPPRFGYLQIPQDGTVRSLDLLGGPEAEEVIDGDGKRLFTWTYVVRAYSEILPYQIDQLPSVENLDLNLTTFDLVIPSE
jgi:hypothetical protein